VILEEDLRAIYSFVPLNYDTSITELKLLSFPLET
jgi:hypothetical protein